jgi:hypothetical protein
MRIQLTQKHSPQVVLLITAVMRACADVRICLKHVVLQFINCTAAVQL